MYEKMTAAQTLEQLKSRRDVGLYQKEVDQRLQKYGGNAFEKAKEKSMLELFLAQLNEPLIFILFLAAMLSALLREFSDTAIIMVVIFINALVGVIQEGRARKALDALKKLSGPSAFVRRDGTMQEVPVTSLVPGDVVILEAGRQVPADLRLLESVSLKVEESALTGESISVEKDAAYLAKNDLPLAERRNMAYMSTYVVYGRGEGVVVATGMQTEMGKIAKLIREEKEEITPLQKRLADLGNLLSFLAVFLCASLFVVSVIQKRNVAEMLITAISLAVAAVPEGLPAVVTIVLALSVSRMVKINTIIRRLPSVETLGAVNVVCSDKTGTLTQNQMTVTHCYVDRRFIPVQELDFSRDREFVEGFLLCNDSRIEGGNRIGDPTELALLDMGLALGIKKDRMDKERRRVGEKPFDSQRKMMTTVHIKNGKKVAYTKGSCDEVLRRCDTILAGNHVRTLKEEDKKEINRVMEQMATEALRVLALARNTEKADTGEKNLTFIGFVGMMDPARPEASHAVDIFRQAGVETVMITGDHVDTAFAIAKQLSITDRKEACMTGAELSNLSDRELRDRIAKLRVFARVSPEHKVRIVKALKENGKIVAMTGDGVNDAPSLKAADIGIAMGKNGTDVAKEAADIVLTDDNFATIEKAIEEGRGIYANIKKSILFLLSSNFGEIITMFVAIILRLASPLKASHILWINLITDSLPALALGVDDNDKRQLMNRPPRKASDSLFAHGGLFITLFYGALIAGISLWAFLSVPYFYLEYRQLPITLESLKDLLRDPNLLARAQTYAFTVLGLSQLFHAIGMRNINRSVFRMNHLSNKMMLAALLIGFFLQACVTEIPYFISAFGTVKLYPGEWLSLICLSSAPLLAHEVFLIFGKFHIHLT